MAADIIELAAWLAEHVDWIAADEQAGEIFHDIRDTVEQIERIVNRPQPGKFCGTCPTITENKSGQRHQCAIPLWVKWDTKNKCYPNEVQCWKCHTVHNIERLIQHALNDVHDWLWTAREVLEVMRQIGEPISDRTWRHWRATGIIQSRNELGAEPRYYLDEVRHLRATSAKIAS